MSLNWRYWRIFRWTWPPNTLERYGAIPDGKTNCREAYLKAVKALGPRGGALRLLDGRYCMGTASAVHLNSEAK